MIAWVIFGLAAYEAGGPVHKGGGLSGENHFAAELGNTLGLIGFLAIGAIVLIPVRRGKRS